MPVGAILCRFLPLPPSLAKARYDHLIALHPENFPHTTSPEAMMCIFDGIFRKLRVAVMKMKCLEDCTACSKTYLFSSFMPDICRISQDRQLHGRADHPRLLQWLSWKTPRLQLPWGPTLLFFRDSVEKQPDTQFLQHTAHLIQDNWANAKQTTLLIDKA